MDELRYDPLGGARPAGATFAMFDELRARHPMFRSTFGEGFWVLSRYDLILEALQDPVTFSNAAVSVLDPNPRYRWIPEMLDQPEHTVWRRLLRPLFSPAAVNAMSGKIRERCTAMVDDLAARGSCDFVTDFARRFPTTVFLELLGLPVEELGTFLAWEDAILHGGSSPDRLPKRLAAMREVTGYFAGVVAERRENPRDDLISTAVTWEIDGRPVPDEDLLDLCLLLFMAGLDTVTAQLSYAFWHLATHPGDRSRIAAEPGAILDAMEELMRAYSIVMPARKVTRDVDFHGCPMKAGDMLLIPLNQANRDPAVFPDADQVVLGRQRNRHMAFGVGIHRCLGGHLARAEMRIAMEEWHRVIPDYRVPDGAQPMEHADLLLGLDTLPLTWS
ncbi:cytochrome P450 [Planotetraspora sp. GP83]|uniref:cytochrome P450 n=1 Tax=Planotetraspora sp. GP83 TaxID=3156264 RepID=UPI0035112D52